MSFFYFMSILTVQYVVSYLLEEICYSYNRPLGGESDLKILTIDG